MKITGKRQSHIFAEIIKTILRVIITVVVVAAQTGFYYFLILGIRKLWFVQLALAILGVVIVFMLYRKNVNSAYKLSWTIFILAFPFVGTVCYILFGGGHALPHRKMKKLRAIYEDKIPPSDETLDKLSRLDARGAMIAKALAKASRLAFYENTQAEFFPTAREKHESLLRDIENAKEYIFIEYFIISDGFVLESVISALEKKGREGVKIKFIYDDIGSKKALKRRTKKRLARIENLELCVFEPVGAIINPRINYRDHRKIVVIDGSIGYIGGDNLADEYVGRLVKYGKWRDNAMRLLGDAVYSLQLIFSESWFLACGEKLDFKEYKKSETKSDGFILPFGDGPTNPYNPAHTLFESLVTAATKYLYISTPYFIIDNAFINLLCLAARSGVDVRLLVPHKPDKKLIFAITRGHYGELLKAGVKIYEYSPGFNHAKNIIVDDEYAFIGTVNCDYRSLMLHFENGAFLAKNSQIEKMRADFEHAIEESEIITLEKWKRRSLFTKITEVALSFIAPLL